MYDLIIIGSGPAGLSAAVYGMRAGMNLIVIEKNPMSGGQILNTYEVDNYLGLPGINGYDMGVQFREHAEKMGAVFTEEEVAVIERAEENRGFRIITDQKTYETRTVLLATGAQHAMLGVPGEEELSGMGVSYCATCDGAFFRGRSVAVVGGGDVALEDAIYLTKFCEKVYVIHRRDSFRGAKVLQERLLSLPNVEILYSHQVKEICGEDAVEKVLLTDKDGQEKELAVDGVFVAVGIHPVTELLQNFVTMDEAGYILAGEDGITSTEGIFVAGDVRKKQLRQIITAVSDGANAINSIGNYLNRS